MLLCNYLKKIKDLQIKEIDWYKLFHLLHTYTLFIHKKNDEASNERISLNLIGASIFDFQKKNHKVSVMVIPATFISKDALRNTGQSPIIFKI